MKVVAPSNAYDAKGMMTAAIRDDSPVVYMFAKSLQGMGWLGVEDGALARCPVDSYTVPLDSAATVREGSDVTIVGLAAGVHHGLRAANMLAEEGVSAEVVDLRSLVPLDRDHVFETVKKTGRLIVIDDDYKSYGVTGEIITTIAERDVSVLKASPKRVAFPDIPIPYSRPMEQWAMPSADKVVDAYRQMET